MCVCVCVGHRVVIDFECVSSRSYGLGLSFQGLKFGVGVLLQ